MSSGVLSPKETIIYANIHDYRVYINRLTRALSIGEVRVMTSLRYESSLIADQLRRAFDGDAWHGPALLELLRGVDAPTAAAKPVPDSHSIWELVMHVA